MTPLRRLARTRLTRVERGWAEAIFAAILAPETAGLPAFAAADRGAFWRCVEDAPGALFGHGLRAMVATITFVPLLDPRHRRPFFALAPEARRDLVAELYADPRFVVRQAVTALKMLACMAYLDDPAARAAFAPRTELA